MTWQLQEIHRGCRHGNTIWIGKISKFHEKKAQKVDFRICLDPFWGFTLKTVLGIHDPRISWLPFGTKNHEMRGPPYNKDLWKFEGSRPSKDTIF